MLTNKQRKYKVSTNKYNYRTTNYGEEIYKPERIQARTADLLLAFAVDDQMKNCASLYSI